MNTWQSGPRLNKSVTPGCSFHQTTVFFSHAWMDGLFNGRVMVETNVSSSHQRVNVSPGEKQSSLPLLITSSDGSDADFIQHRAYGFWQVCDWGVIGARGPWKQLLWKRDSARVLLYFVQMVWTNLVRVYIPVSVDIVLSPNGQLKILTSKCVSNMILQCRWGLKQRSFCLD